MPEFTKTIEVGRSAEKAFALALDFKSYRKFIPALKDVEVDNGDSEKPVVTFTLTAPAGDIRYTVRYTVEEPRRITWEMLESNVLKGNSGHWIIEAAGEDRASVTYSMTTKLPVWLSWAITDKAYAEQIGKTVGQFKKYLEGKP